MIRAKYDGQYKQVGFIKVRQPDGTYKDVEKKYGKTTGGEYGLVFEKGFTREVEGGLPIQLNGIGKPLKDYGIKGNAYQSDGVSPDTPQEVKGCGERTGNLFSSKWEQGYLNVNGDAQDDTTRIRTADYIPITPNTVYSIKRSVYFNYINLRLYDKDKNFLAIGGDDTVEIITGHASANPMKAGQYFCCFKVILADAVFIKFCDLSNDLSTEYMMVEGEYTASTMPKFEPYGYKVDVECRGKNLVRVADDNYIYYSVLNNFTIQEDKLILTNETLVGFKVKVKPNTTYTIQRKRETNVSCDFRIREYSAEPTEWETDFLKQSLNVRVDYASFTSSADTAWVLVVFYLTRSAGSLTISNIQLELGTEATSYEPYTPPITTPIYFDSPLYKIGDYADSRGMTEEVRVIKELVLTGEENWQLWNDDYFSSVIDRKGKISNIYCTHFINSNASGISYATNSSAALKIDSSSISFVSDVSELKAWLAAQYAAGTPVKVYYVLATPESKTVEPVEIPTLDGTTVIDVDTEVKPSNVYIKYKSKT